MFTSSDFTDMITSPIHALDRLIREEQTGNCRELAKKAGFTRRQLRVMFRFMKDCEGILIWFDRKRNTYYYVPGPSEN